MSKLRVSLGEQKIEIAGYEGFRNDAYGAVRSLKVNVKTINFVNIQVHMHKTFMYKFE